MSGFEDIKEVGEMLKIGEEKGLTCEMVLFALYSMRKHPEQSIREATDAGVYEWDK